MSERNVFIGVAILLLVGAALYGGFTKFKSDFETVPQTSPAVSPSPSDILFKSMSPTKAAKQIKQYKNFPKLSPLQLKNKKAIIETQKVKLNSKFIQKPLKLPPVLFFSPVKSFLMV